MLLKIGKTTPQRCLKRLPGVEYTRGLNCPVVNTLGSLDSPVMNMPGSLDSPVTNTPGSRLLGVFGPSMRTGLQKTF